MIRANMFGQTERQEKLVLTPEEEKMIGTVRASWKAILSLSNIEDHTDFFNSGAGSMDVTRWGGRGREGEGGGGREGGREGGR